MRIFLSSQQALRPHAVPAYAFWEYYFKQGLAEAGHEVIETPEADWAEGLTALPPADRQRWLGDTWTRTTEFLRAAHARKPVDLFLSYLFPNQVEPAAIATIRALGIPCVNFFCDNVREFTKIPESFRAFDCHWVPEAEGRELYQKAKLPFVYAPMPVWVPPAFRKLPERENDHVTFIGSHDALRESLLASSVQAGLPLRLHGAGWRATESEFSPEAQPLGKKISHQITFLRNHGLHGLAMKLTYRFRPRLSREWIDTVLKPAPTNDEYLPLLRESAVTLGINRFPSFRHSFTRPAAYSRLRDLEAPMLGACYLTEDAPGLTDLFEDGVEIETYRTVDELVEKARALRADPKRRRQLRERGQRRALTQHTIARSIETITRALH